VHDIDGAPKKNQHAINVSTIRQPNDDVGKKGAQPMNPLSHARGTPSEE